MEDNDKVGEKAFIFKKKNEKTGLKKAFNGYLKKKIHDLIKIRTLDDKIEKLKLK